MLSFPQATTYKLDFEQERSDREKATCRFEEEREAMQAANAKLTEQLRTVQPYITVSAQLPRLLQKSEVRFKLDCISAGRTSSFLACALACMSTCVCASAYFLYLILDAPLWRTPSIHYHAHKHTHTSMHTHACTHTYTCTHTHKHACIHKHTHTYMDTYTHAVSGLSSPALQRGRSETRAHL